jgi:hypothetical protein
MIVLSHFRIDVDRSKHCGVAVAKDRQLYANRGPLRWKMLQDFSACAVAPMPARA